MTQIAPIQTLFERAVRAYVAQGSGIERKWCIPGDDGNPSPKHPQAYSTVTQISETADGTTWTLERPGSRGSDPTVFGTTFQSKEVQFSVQWFRAGAQDMARRFQIWASSPLGIQSAAWHGLTFYRTSAMRELDAQVSEEYEERAGLDLVLGLVFVLESDLGRYETARVVVKSDELGDDPATGPDSTPGSADFFEPVIDFTSDEETPPSCN